MTTERETLRLPKIVRPRAEAISSFTDQFCAKHLDAEYAQLCRHLVAKLARKRPSPLLRGDLRIWAAAVIYTIGGLNFLFDRSQQPHLSTDDLSALTSVPKSTMANKAKLTRDALKINLFSFEFQRRELVEQNPAAWLIMVDGFLVDARMMPPEIQAEARRRGLIPDLPPPGEGQVQDGA
jgi:hypothetical protein